MGCVIKLSEPGAHTGSGPGDTPLHFYCRSLRTQLEVSLRANHTNELGSVVRPVMSESGASPLQHIYSPELR